MLVQMSSNSPIQECKHLCQSEAQSARSSRLFEVVCPHGSSEIEEDLICLTLSLRAQFHKQHEILLKYTMLIIEGLFQCRGYPINTCCLMGLS